MHKVDVCMVSFNDDRHIEGSIKCLRTLNPDCEFRFIISNNSKNSLSINNVLDEDLLIDGPQRKHAFAWNRNPSEWHGEALNSTINHVNARFLLIVDPDFYVLRNNGLHDLIRIFDTSHISAIGVPWHPKWKYKPKNCPTAHFLLIDLKKINKANLDFRPDSPHWAFKIPLINYFLPKLKLDWLRYGLDRDTGSRLISKNSLQRSTLLLMDPIHKHSETNCVASAIWFVFKYWESCRGVRTKSPKLLSKEDVIPLGSLDVESFLFQNDLFGVHVRGHPRGARNKDKESLDVMEFFYEVNKLKK